MRWVNGAGLILLVFGIISAIATFGMIPDDSLGLAWIEVLRFFLFTCAAGGAVFLYKQLQAENQREQERRQEVLDIRMSIVEAFHGIKKARRMMRVLAKHDESGFHVNLPKEWIVQVESLNEYHLLIEKLRRQNMSDVASSALKTDLLAPQLKTIDDYIRRVLTEIESSHILADGTISCEEGAALPEFLFGKSPPEYIQAFEIIDGSMRETVRNFGSQIDKTVNIRR